MLTLLLILILALTSILSAYILILTLVVTLILILVDLLTADINSCTDAFIHLWYQVRLHISSPWLYPYTGSWGWQSCQHMWLTYCSSKNALSLYQNPVRGWHSAVKKCGQPLSESCERLTCCSQKMRSVHDRPAHNTQHSHPSLIWGWHAFNMLLLKNAPSLYQNITLNWHE